MTADIIAAARQFAETPFVHQGRIPGMALDCAGLVVMVAKTLGLEYHDQTGYARRPSGGLLEAALDAQPCLERITALEPGCVLLMRFKDDPQHLGIYTGETIIHAWQPVGKVCEHTLDAAWQRRIVRIYRFKGLIDG